MRVALPLFVFVLVLGGCCGGLQSAGEAAPVPDDVGVEAVTPVPAEEPPSPDEVGRPPKRLGKVSQRGGVRFFARMDTDGDGGISAEEFRGTEGRFAEVDTNGDGVIGATEFEAARPDRMGRKGSFMGRHDANEDGKITLEEFQGKETRFTKLDVNSDGYIDETEVPTGRREENPDDDDEAATAPDAPQDDPS